MLTVKDEAVPSEGEAGIVIPKESLIERGFEFLLAREKI